MLSWTQEPFDSDNKIARDLKPLSLREPWINFSWYRYRYRTLVQMLRATSNRAAVLVGKVYERILPEKLYLPQKLKLQTEQKIAKN